MEKKKVPFKGHFRADDGQGGKVEGHGEGEISYTPTSAQTPKPPSQPPARHGGSFHPLGEHKEKFRETFLDN